MSLQTTYRTTPKIATIGGLADSSSDGVSVFTGFSTEASAMIPFGNAVEFDPLTGQGYDGFLEGAHGVKLPNATTDKICGILIHDPNSSDITNDGTLDGMEPKAVLNILRRGRIWVKPETSSSVAVGARLYVRAVTAGEEYKGALRGAADSTDCIDCTNQGVWLTAPDADGMALLEVDFVNAQLDMATLTNP